MCIAPWVCIPPARRCVCCIYFWRHMGPLQVGVFDGDPERVRMAFTGPTELAKAVAGNL
jgi:hypothetical protein